MKERTRRGEKPNIKNKQKQKAKMNFLQKFYRKIIRSDVWARPEMEVTFRAELMPGKSREERTFRIREVLPNHRVILYDIAGERRQSEFEPVNFKRETLK